MRAPTLRKVAILIGFATIRAVALGGYVWRVDNHHPILGAIVGLIIGMASISYIVPFLIRTDLRITLPIVFLCTAYFVRGVIVTGQLHALEPVIVAFIIEFVLSALCWVVFADKPCWTRPWWLCRKCGYDLRGISGRCPECATPFTEPYEPQADGPSGPTYSDARK